MTGVRLHGPAMRWPLLAVALAACGIAPSGEHYGFIARLGRDTVAVESITRRPDALISDEVDRFPRVRQRHTEVSLRPDGSISRLVMDIHEPGRATPLARDRHVSAEFGADSVRIAVLDSGVAQHRAFRTGGALTTVHVPQMYGLYELYIAAALAQGTAAKLSEGDSIHVLQVYADREFDRFPLHEGWVQPLRDGKVDVWHDWLSGVGSAVVDSSRRLRSWSGTRTTYKVDVQRLADPPNVAAIGAQFAATEKGRGPVTPLSVRDTARGTVGRAAFTIDYGRPLARGRVLVGDVIPYGEVWRTGANAATQFTTSAPISLAGLRVPAGTYTLWTMPRTAGGVDLIVNKQTGQWGTSYDPELDLGAKPLHVETAAGSVEKFTIAVQAADATHGTLVMEWGTFRWTAPIVVR